eukprot:TRINITY_DN1204_c0_g1_i1.p1 TRINITY_DN1204_c0_g1~~TRINITY_DN1204_c0_g1_i1.p1  ORF type:complete len:112 (+),score=9.33 TRINITY_DN1204_c0_g1_i1:73-408(+)
MSTKVIKPHIVWWILIVVGMLHTLQMAYLWLMYNPFMFIGLSDELAITILKWIWWIALFLHVGEGSFSFYLCLSNDYPIIDALSWYLQTFILGYPSLRLLKIQIISSKKIY